MAKKITTEQVRQIAELANLDFQEEELAEFATQFSDILDYVQQLERVDTAAAEPLYNTASWADDQPLSREDRIEASLEVTEVLEMAPESDDDQFSVPRVID